MRLGTDSQVFSLLEWLKLNIGYHCIHEKPASSPDPIKKVKQTQVSRDEHGSDVSNKDRQPLPK